MLAVLLPVLLRCLRGDRPTAKQLVNQPGGRGELTMKFQAVGDSSPPTPC